jgi:putative transposase
MDGFDELVAVHIPHRDAARLTGVSRSTAARRHPTAPPAQLRARTTPTAPGNKLTPAERIEVLHVLNCDRFVDQTPLQIYPTLLEEGRYLCSVSTMYRVLRENAQVKDRRRQARHPPRAVPELQATTPGQVFSWDITKLAGPVKGQYFDAYVMIDIYSRMIVGVHVHHSESAVLAVDMMKQIFKIHGNPQVVHADRGTSMTSKLVSALLSDLQITQSHSRPRVSNDNPYSEAWFKTLKYAPIFPDRFTNLGAARTFMSDFVDYYNHHHRHTGIGLHTPADVHYGHAGTTQNRRIDTLTTARTQHPTRFTTPTIIPKILALPQTAWINQPQDDNQTSAA